MTIIMKNEQLYSSIVEKENKFSKLVLLLNNNNIKTINNSNYFITLLNTINSTQIINTNNNTESLFKLLPIFFINKYSIVSNNNKIKKLESNKIIPINSKYQNIINTTSDYIVNNIDTNKYNFFLKYRNKLLNNVSKNTLLYNYINLLKKKTIISSSNIKFSVPIKKVISNTKYLNRYSKFYLKYINLISIVSVTSTIHTTVPINTAINFEKNNFNLLLKNNSVGINSINYLNKKINLILKQKKLQFKKSNNLNIFKNNFKKNDIYKIVNNDKFVFLQNKLL